MLFVTQLSSARGIAGDVCAQASIANVSSAQSFDASESTTPDSPLTQVCVADLSSDLSEPVLPLEVGLSPEVAAARPAAYQSLMLPYPLLEGPQRPPRVLRA